jgi:hypothetical protein
VSAEIQRSEPLSKNETGGLEAGGTSSSRSQRSNQRRAILLFSGKPLGAVGPKSISPAVEGRGLM